MAGTFYNNNPLLKSAGVQIGFNPEETAEYLKCLEDPIYFIRNYVKIISLDRGLVPFELYDYQERFIRSLHDNRMVVTMMPRQSGKTICIAAYVCWYVLFNDAKTVAILANKAAAAREVMSRVQLIYEHLPMFLQQGVSEWNKGNITLENNSKIFTAATTASGIRGKSVSYLVVDEAAIIPNTVAEEFFASTYPTISSGKTTKITLASTPLGLNHFWKFWTEAEENINGFVPVRVHYYEHPDRDEAWAQEQKRLLGELKFNQEVLCDFIGSASNLVSAAAIQRLPVKRPIYESADGVCVYENPVKATGVNGPQVPGVYVMTVDTSEGVGGDYSTFSIFRIGKDCITQVMRYRNNAVSPLVFPSIAHKWATHYNDAAMLIEINKSEQVAYILHSELAYENILYIGKGKQGQKIGGPPYAYGIKTDKKTKRIGCMVLKDLIEQGKLIVHDAETIAELSTFIEDKKGSYGADDGKHDDLVMTLVLFAWITNDPYYAEITNEELRRQIFQERLRAIEDEALPIVLFDEGPTSADEGNWINYNL